MFGKLFHWFYCLPIGDAVFLVIFATFIFLLLKNALRQRLWWKPAVGLLLALWIAVIFLGTVIGRETGSAGSQALVPFHSYQAVLSGGNPEILRSNFMNVVLFYPAGLLAASCLPDKWPRCFRIFLPLVLFIVLSAGIEYAQYAYTLGRVEIDDVIHNALGALLGSICGVIQIQVTE